MSDKSHNTARKAATISWVVMALPAIVAATASGVGAASRLPGDMFHTPYSDILHNSADLFRITVSASLWAGFITVWIMLLLPGSIVLTIIRVVVPANAVMLLWASALVDSSLWSGGGLGGSGLGLNGLGSSDRGWVGQMWDDYAWIGHGLTLIAGLLVAIIVMLPTFADAVIDASSYGDERRFLLRPPGPALIALMIPLWLVTVAGTLCGPLMLANKQWEIGAIVTLPGLALAFISIRLLHKLACRWVVFVPGGLVLHDQMSVCQAMPVSRRSIASIGPAQTSAALEATDLTAQAFGLALAIRLAEPTVTAVVTGRGKTSEQSVTIMLISPSRPADVIHTAQQRGIKVA